MKELNMSNGSAPINVVHKANRAAVTAMTASRASGPQRTFRDRPALMAAFAVDVAAFVAGLSRKQAGVQ
jgi:hypothetical protein